MMFRNVDISLNIPANWKMQIKPLIEPTRLIMKIGVQSYDWHELFPKGICQFF